MLIFRLLFCLTTKAFLSPQLLVYMPIDLPVHYPTCSFYFIPTNQLYLPVLSPVLNIHRFTFSSINRFNLCVSFTWLYMHTYLSIHLLVCVPTDPRENDYVPANFDATCYVNLPVHLQTRVHRSCSS